MLTAMAVAAHPIATSEPSTHTSDSDLQLAQVNRVEQICVDAVRTSGYRVNSILATNTFSGGAEVLMTVQDRGEPIVVGCDYSDNTSRIELYQVENRSSRYEDDNNGRYGGQYGDEYNDRYNSRYDRQYDEQYNGSYDDRYDRPYPYSGRYEDRYENRYETRYETRYEDIYEDMYDDRSNNGYGEDDRYNNRQERGSNSVGVRNGRDAEYIAREAVGDQLGIGDPYSDIVRIDDVHRQANRQSNNRDWIVEGRVNGAPFVVKIRSSDAYILDFELR